MPSLPLSAPHTNIHVTLLIVGAVIADALLHGQKIVIGTRGKRDGISGMTDPNGVARLKGYGIAVMTNSERAVDRSSLRLKLRGGSGELGFTG